MKVADSVIIKFFVTVNIMFFMVPSFLSTETMINYMCVLIYTVSCRCFPRSEVAASVEYGFFILLLDCLLQDFILSFLCQFVADSYRG